MTTATSNYTLNETPVKLLHLTSSLTKKTTGASYEAWCLRPQRGRDRSGALSAWVTLQNSASIRVRVVSWEGMLGEYASVKGTTQRRHHTLPHATEYRPNYKLQMICTSNSNERRLSTSNEGNGWATAEMSHLEKANSSYLILSSSEKWGERNQFQRNPVSFHSFEKFDNWWPIFWISFFEVKEIRPPIRKECNQSQLESL